MLYGRESETGAIVDALDRAQRGHGAALLIHGEPGLGKTALLRYARDQAADMRILVADCSPTEAAVPFGALSLLIRPLRNDIEDLPDLERNALIDALSLRLTTDKNHYPIYAAFLALLSAARRPLLVCVDNAQWLDRSSAEALMFAARRLRAEGVAMLVAGRPQDDPGNTREIGLAVLRLRPLGRDASLRVIAAAARDRETHAAVAVEIARQAAGHPDALAEIVRGLDDGQLAGRGPLPDPLPSAASAGRLFGPRVTSLDAAARRAMLVAAVHGEGELGPVLSALRLARVPDSALEALENADLVSLSGHRITFSHPLVRSAAIDLARPRELREAHRVLADALQEPRLAERRAWHLAEACLAADEQVSNMLEETAEIARRRGGHAAAAQQLDRAAELSPDSGHRSRRWHLAADHARRAGRPGYAALLLDKARANGPQEPTTYADRTRGRFHLFTGGDPDQAAALLRAAADSLAAHKSPAAAPAYADAAMAAFLAGDPVRASDHAFAAMTPELAAPAGISMVSGLIVGMACLQTGHVVDGLRMLREAVAAVHERGVSTEDLEYAVFLALAHVWVGDLPAARTLTTTLVDELRTRAAFGTLPLALYGSAYAHLASGRFTTARDQASEAVELAGRTGNPLWSYFALSCLSLVEAHQGDERGCREHAAAASALRDSSDLRFPRDSHNALGLQELSLARPKAALAHLEAAHRNPRPGSAFVFHGPSGSDLVEAYVRALGAVPGELAEQVIHQSGHLDPGGDAALAWRCRGLMADDEMFTEFFEHALALHSDAGSRYDRARTEFCFGERLRRTGRRRDARRHLRQAYEAFLALGSPVWARRSADELRATGEQVRPVLDGGQEGLTPQEHRVAVIVAAGATNNEAAETLFLSPKTIEAHLCRIYRKLGIRSRAQLAARFRPGS
ncbi:LuxR family transcriptional regulator [Nonomuraea monospora]|uniref:LuxR family transcriptional regulator n=1 Tax=Nonomuraea monospora TaxID=568818 RepID=UPI0031DEE908